MDSSLDSSLVEDVAQATTDAKKPLYLIAMMPRLTKTVVHGSGKIEEVIASRRAFRANRPISSMEDIKGIEKQLSKELGYDLIIIAFSRFED